MFPALQSFKGSILSPADFTCPKLPEHSEDILYFGRKLLDSPVPRVILKNMVVGTLHNSRAFVLVAQIVKELIIEVAQVRFEHNAMNLVLKKPCVRGMAAAE